MKMSSPFTQLHQAISRELPGEHRDLYVGSNEGPVTTRTPDGSHHVSYIVVTQDQNGDVTGLEVRYQESFEDPYNAGVEFQELKEYAPEPPDSPIAKGQTQKRDLLERKIAHQKADQRWLVEEAGEDLRMLFGEEH